MAQNRQTPLLNELMNTKPYSYTELYKQHPECCRHIHTIVPIQSQRHVNLPQGHTMSLPTKHPFSVTHVATVTLYFLSLSLLQSRCVSVAQSLGTHPHAL